MKQGQPKRWQVLLWPPVTDEKYRRVMIGIGCFTAFFYAAWWLIALFGAVYGIIEHDTGVAYKPLESLVHLVIAAVIGWGILKRSKIASSAAVFLSLAGAIGNWSENGFTSNSIQFLIMVLIFSNSTRAVFAYHKATGAERNEKV